MADSASDSAGTAEPSAEQAENATADGLGGGDLVVESSTVTWVVGFLILCAAGGMALAWRRHQRRKPIDPFIDMLTRPKYYIKLPPEREVFLDARDAFNPDSDDPKELRFALMRRAIATIPLIMFIQQEKRGIHALYARAMIGEADWRSFQDSDEMVSNEVEDVKAEADEIMMGWSDHVWREAMGISQAMQKKREEAEQAGEAKEQEKQSAKKAKQAEGKKKKSAAKAAEDAEASAQALIKEEEAAAQKKKGGKAKKTV